MTDRERLQAWEACQRLRRLDAALARELEVRCGLSSADYEVLAAVDATVEECVRVSALADAMRWSRSRLSRQLARMERRGLVGREACERDGRGDDVVLTPEGSTALESARPVHDVWVREQVEGVLSARDRATLTRIARALVPD